MQVVLHQNVADWLLAFAPFLQLGVEVGDELDELAVGRVSVVAARFELDCCEGQELLAVGGG